MIEIEADSGVDPVQPQAAEPVELIEGCQSLGAELLKTGHWVATHEPKGITATDTVSAVHRRNDCKAKTLS